MGSRNVIAVFSGGMDSTTLVTDLVSMGYEVDCVSFDYGQRHNKELEFAEATTTKLGLRHDIVDLTNLTELLAESGSSLISRTAVPEGHYAEDNMKKTVVPNRNMIMLAIAGGIAVAREARFIATAVHAGDHFVYPDCRPQFINALSLDLLRGNEGFGHDGQGVSILAPFLFMSKAQIARLAIMHGLPFEETWSCYKGDEKHCGKCGTCVERLEAIAEAIAILTEEGNPIARSFEDKTEYEDREFWEKAVEEANA